MRTDSRSSQTLRLTLGAGVLALLLAGAPAAAFADDLLPVSSSGAAAGVDMVADPGVVAETVAGTPGADAEAGVATPSPGASPVGTDVPESAATGAAAVGAVAVDAVEPDAVAADQVAASAGATTTDPADGNLLEDGPVVVPAPGEQVVPVITSGPLPDGTVGVPYRFQVTANVNPVTFSITGLPAGLTANPATGLITGTPTTAGTSTVRLQAIGADPGDTSFVSYNTVVIAPAPVIIPVITSGPLPGGTVGVPYRFQVTANVTPVTFSITGLPAGLTANSATGLITGTPTTASTSTVRLQAIGANPGDTSFVSYNTVVIAPAPVIVPVITSDPLPDGTIGVSYSFQVTSNVTPVTFSISGLPTGLSANPRTGLITGTPRVLGTYSVRLQATGADPGDTSFVVYNAVVVRPASSSTPPVITSAAPPAAVVAADYVFQITTDAQTPTFSAEGLPAGLSLDTLTGVITGRPTTTGTYPVVFGVVDGQGQPATQQQVIQVDAAEIAPPTITSGPLPDGTVGIAYSFRLSSSATVATFTAAGLPTGLALEPLTGRITGTPSSSGTFQTIVTAAIPGGLTSQPVRFDLTIRPATVGGGAPPASTTGGTTLPNAPVASAPEPAVAAPGNPTFGAAAVVRGAAAGGGSAGTVAHPSSAHSSGSSELAETGQREATLAAVLGLGFLLLIAGTVAAGRRRRA